MERRTVVYRGAIREEAESAYHDDAVKAAADGFVPTSETWSAALGQQVLTVDYVFQPEQAPAVIAALHDVETRPISANEPATPPSGAPTVAGPVSATSAPMGNRRPNALGCLALIALAVVAWVAFSAGNSGRSDSSTPPPAAPAEVSHLTGTFLRWEPVDEANGYAYFSITNSGATTEIAECKISVKNGLWRLRVRHPGWRIGRPRGDDIGPPSA